jgi:hypothetical protein
MAFLMLHPIFSILQVLLLNLEEKILTVMEYMIKMMRVQIWFKNSTVVLILMETESKIVLMLVQTYLV